MTDEQFKKLPKYAQEEIQVMNKRIKMLEDQLAALQGEETSIKANIPDYTNLGSHIYLPEYSGVTFTLPSGKINVQINLDGRLRVEAVHGRIITMPLATNVNECEVLDYSL